MSIRDEVREQIGRHLAGWIAGSDFRDDEYWSVPGNRQSWLQDADLVIDDSPALLRLLRVEAAIEGERTRHQPEPAVDVGPGGEYPRDMCSCGEAYYDICDVVAALDRISAKGVSQ